MQGDAFDVASSAIVDNRDAIKGTLGSSSKVFSCMFAGQNQSLAWKGRPSFASHNLARARDLGDRLGKHTNRELVQVDDFPNVFLPDEFDVVGVHLALERARKRGESDPPGKLLGIRRARAEVHAVEALEHLKRGRMDDARRSARVALGYLGDQPLSEAPAAVIDVAALVQE